MSSFSPFDSLGHFALWAALSVGIPVVVLVVWVVVETLRDPEERSKLLLGCFQFGCFIVVAAATITLIVILVRAMLRFLGQ